MHNLELSGQGAAAFLAALAKCEYVYDWIGLAEDPLTLMLRMEGRATGVSLRMRNSGMYSIFVPVDFSLLAGEA